jgi:hypothetical protein
LTSKLHRQGRVFELFKKLWEVEVSSEFHRNWRIQSSLWSARDGHRSPEYPGCVLQVFVPVVLLPPDETLDPVRLELKGKDLPVRDLLAVDVHLFSETLPKNGGKSKSERHYNLGNSISLALL